MWYIKNQVLRRIMLQAIVNRYLMHTERSHVTVREGDVWQLPGLCGAWKSFFENNKLQAFFCKNPPSPKCCCCFLKSRTIFSCASIATLNNDIISHCPSKSFDLVSVRCWQNQTSLNHKSATTTRIVPAQVALLNPFLQLYTTMPYRYTNHVWVPHPHLVCPIRLYVPFIRGKATLHCFAKSRIILI